jgi:hopanoid biosynthesis associated RND transporter like protein HpnN
MVVNLVVGLAVTAGLGLFMVGAFNLISIYFAVLFVGIGVDFAIQFSVRYRDERHTLNGLREAILSAGSRVATPLSLAALATAAGFFSFLPTQYKGVSELGTIAGAGMLIAFLTSMTVLPALIFLVDPAGEPEPLGYRFLAPVDEYLAQRRRPILFGTILIVVCALPALFWLKFDFNPLDLQSPNSEAIATYSALQRDPSLGANAIQALEPSLEQADASAARLRRLRQVLNVTTLSTFIPTDQEQKLPLVQRAADVLRGAFDAKEAQPAPTDPENVDALKEGAGRLLEAAGKQTGAGPEAARRLSTLLTQLAGASPETRASATRALVWPLDFDLQSLERSLAAQPVTRESLPRELVDGWIAADGRARLSIAPRASADDSAALRSFAEAVQAVQPNATEGPITTLKAADLILRAFIEAGAWAFASIAILLLIVLRRPGDVFLTLAPLALAGFVTMEVMSLSGLEFNFANIIALPLLLGVGVAFKIYYIIAWREGTTHLLQTPLTRAVFYSALTTATAFGSLWLSSNPGVSSMGKLLALSLVATLAAAVLFQPILMGKPRNPKQH